MAVDEELSELFVAIGADEDLSAVQQVKYSRLLFSFMASHWQVYYQAQKGFLDDEILDAYERRTVAIFANRTASNWWAENKLYFADSFQRFVDVLL